MLSWALIFLVVAIVAALFGFSGVAGSATQIAWILFIVGLNPGRSLVHRRPAALA